MHLSSPLVPLLSLGPSPLPLIAFLHLIPLILLIILYSPPLPTYQCLHPFLMLHFTPILLVPVPVYFLSPRPISLWFHTHSEVLLVFFVHIVEERRHGNLILGR